MLGNLTPVGGFILGIEGSVNGISQLQNSLLWYRTESLSTKSPEDKELIDRHIRDYEFLQKNAYNQCLMAIENFKKLCPEEAGDIKLEQLAKRVTILQNCDRLLTTLNHYPREDFDYNFYFKLQRFILRGGNFNIIDSASDKINISKEDTQIAICQQGRNRSQTLAAILAKSGIKEECIKVLSVESAAFNLDAEYFVDTALSQEEEADESFQRAFNRRKMQPVDANWLRLSSARTPQERENGYTNDTWFINKKREDFKEIFDNWRNPHFMTFMPKGLSFVLDRILYNPNNRGETDLSNYKITYIPWRDLIQDPEHGVTPRSPAAYLMLSTKLQKHFIIS